MTTASADLNAILARWLPGPPAQSAQLDCAACARALKCCDFQPFVANFLLGAMLEAGQTLPNPNTGFTYQPLGLIASAEFRERHAQTPEMERGDELLCAFYDRTQRRCSVWPQRPGECSTYLCADATDSRIALSATSFRLETGVAQMALAYLGYSRRAISRQIDLLNTPERGLFSDRDVFDGYRRAWTWARELSPSEAAEFLKEPA